MMNFLGLKVCEKTETLEERSGLTPVWKTRRQKCSGTVLKQGIDIL